MNRRPVLGAILAGPLTAAVLAACPSGPASAQSSTAIPPSLVTPDRVQTSIGTLEFIDGAPTVATAEKIRDTLAFTSALNVYNNSFRGASAYALGKGFQSIGADDNSVIIFSTLMDAKSLFLTANADTVYYMSVVNLTKGPMVVEQPPLGLGTSTTCGSAGSSISGSPAPIAAKAASTWSSHQGTTAHCPKAASSSPGRRPIACCTPRARSS